MNNLGFRYFLVVAKELSFTKAAEKLFISQQSLSAHVQRLEQYYGVTLFQRKPVLKLTIAGEAMAFYAQQMLRAEENMTAKFADLVENYQGRIKLGMSRQRSAIFFNNIWEFYRPNHENISIILEENYTENLLPLIQSGELDLGICVNAQFRKDLEIIPLVTEKLCCSINTTLLQNCRPKTWEADANKFLNEGVDLLTIQDLPFYLLPQKNRLRSNLDQLFATNGVFPKLVLETNNQESMLKLSENGIGIISPMYLYHYWQNQPLSIPLPKVYRIKNNIPNNTISLVYRKGAVLPSYISDIKKIIKNEMLHYKATVNKMNNFKLIF